MRTALQKEQGARGNLQHDGGDDMTTDEEIIKKWHSDWDVTNNMQDLAAIRLYREAYAEGAKGKFSCQVAGCDIPPTLCNKHADLLRDEIKKARASEAEAWRSGQRGYGKHYHNGKYYDAFLNCDECHRFRDEKARADERNASNERADEAFRVVFDKVEEHRKAHKGSCNCPACNPTIAQLYAEFIGKLQASEKPKDRRARSGEEETKR